MKFQIILKADVGHAECQAVSARVQFSDHENNEGAIKSWSLAGYENSMYVVFLSEADGMRTPFGLVVAAGEKHVEVTWWIDSQYRSGGYWKDMIDELAVVLKARGVAHVRARVLGIHSEKSRALYERLQSHFVAARPNPSIERT